MKSIIFPSAMAALWLASACESTTKSSIAETSLDAKSPQDDPTPTIGGTLEMRSSDGDIVVDVGVASLTYFEDQPAQLRLSGASLDREISITISWPSGQSQPPSELDIGSAEASVAVKRNNLLVELSEGSISLDISDRLVVTGALIGMGEGTTFEGSIHATVVASCFARPEPGTAGVASFGPQPIASLDSAWTSSYCASVKPTDD